jgi:hypothetical protein
VQVVLQEVAAGLLAAHLERHFGHVGIAHRGVELVQFAQPGHVGNRLDVEHQCWIHMIFKVFLIM